MQEMIDRLREFIDYECAFETESKRQECHELLNDLESSMKEMEDYVLELEWEGSGLHDTDNFKRLLDTEGLLTKRLDEFIDNYMMFSNE